MQKLDDENKYQDLYLEFEAMASVYHPAIQNPIGLYSPVERSKSVLITPYRENGTLKDLMSCKEKCNSLNLWTIIFGITSAMKHLEEKNSRHGALRTSNILIDHDFHPYLVGIKHKNIKNNDLTEEESIYCAPEVMQGAYANIKSDVYSFGLLIQKIFSETTGLEFIKKIIKDCINPDPNGRKSFSEISRILIINLRNIESIDPSFIREYLSTIDEKLKHPLTSFRFPITIVKNPRLIKSINESPIDYEALERVFSDEPYDRKILLVMVFGQLMIGKSTFLQAITGNGAFLIGKGAESTTQGIMIDGPYKVNELNDRFSRFCRDNEYQKLIPTDDSSPDVFFIDSHGVGDENYEKVKDIIMEKIHSIFCSISDVCLNVTSSNYDFNLMKNNLNTIRRSQMIGNKNMKTNVIFLCREPDENTFKGIRNLSDYKNKSEEFNKRFNEEHKFAIQKFRKSSIYSIPLPNVSNFQTYMSCISYTWWKILEIYKNSNSHSCKNDFMPITQSVSRILFSKGYNDFISDFNSAEVERKYAAKNPIEKDCSYICDLIYGWVNELQKLKDVNTDSTKEINGILNTISICAIFWLPYLLGGEDITFDDYCQCSYDIKMDINSYVKKYIPDLYECVSKATEFDYFCEMDKTPMTTLYKFFFGNFYISKITRVIKFLLSSKIEKFIPFIWEKAVEVPNQPLVLEYDIVRKKIQKLIPKRTFNNEASLLVAIEQPNQDCSKIIESLTGIKCFLNDVDKYVALFGPLDMRETMKRFIRCDREPSSDLMPKFYVLLFKGYSRMEINRLEINEYVTSYFTFIEEKCEIIINQPSDDKQFHVLKEIDSFEFDYASDLNYRKSIEINNKDVTNRNIFRIWPIKSGDGAISSACIKIACRGLLKDKIIS